MGYADWHSYYSKPIHLADAIGSWVYHWPYLLQILLEARSGALEVGCGRGIHSIFLSYFVPNVVGIDNNTKLLGEARKHNSRFRGRARFIERDAFDLRVHEGAFDVCFSQGLLEHFNDREICLLTEQQLSVAKTMVASVPSNHYVGEARGDERLMQMEDWRRILRNYETSMFYYGFEPKNPGKVISTRNLGDIAKIALIKSYRLHICIVAKKAIG